MKQDKREFYVGYLPLPAGIRRTLWGVVPALVVAVVAVGVWRAGGQADPGDGTWDLSEVTEYRGVLVVEPYPMVVVPGAETETVAAGASDEGSEEVSGAGDVSEEVPGVFPGVFPGGMKTVLLASQVKVGVRERVSEWAGRWVTVRGNLAARDGRELLTLLDDASGIEAWDGGGDAPERVPPAGEAQGRFRLTGQIIDPKCYLGAMKPGEGKIHKACATLCLAGGIPPMFMTRDAADRRSLYLLTDADGGAVFETIRPYVADPITAEGVVERRGDLAWFKIEPGTVERLR
ncbi:MAG: hypothetical protein AAGG38_13590 [Planctomycetota bacterium]